MIRNVVVVTERTAGTKQQKYCDVLHKTTNLCHTLSSVKSPRKEHQHQAASNTDASTELRLQMNGAAHDDQIYKVDRIRK